MNWSSPSIVPEMSRWRLIRSSCPAGTAVFQPVERQAAGRVEVADLDVADRVAVEAERVVARPEIRPPGSNAESPSGIGHIRRHARPFGPAQLGDDRADARAARSCCWHWLDG